ncbi:MAG: pitrilysin family protein [Pseudomonadota bacterium]
MRYERLDNGMTLVTDEMDNIDSAAVGVWVHAGARSESAAEHGMAHFLEHMAFKGTARRSATEISNAIEAVGGEINAATSHETTAYHARVLAEDVPLAVDILADILTAPALSPDDIERERNVILQEIGASEDVPEDRAFDAFPEVAFCGQPLGRRILGTRDSVCAVDEAGLRGFLGRHYSAEAMTVAAAGAVSHDALRDMVLTAFECAGHEMPTEMPLARYVGGAFDGEDDGSEVQWILGLEGEASVAPDFWPVTLAAMVLGGGMSSRLFQALREDRGLVYDTSAFHWAFRDTGLFAVHFATQPETVGEAAEVVVDTLADAARTITDTELDRAKAQLRAGMLMARESCVSRMSGAARNAQVYGRAVSKEERIAALAAVTPRDVERVMGQMMASAPTLVRVGSSFDGPSAAEIAERWAGHPMQGAA